MSQGIVGYRKDMFAREAKIIYIDIDNNEIEKNNIDYHLKCNMDLNIFFDNYNYDIIQYNEWLQKCKYWKNKWFFESPEYIKDIVNPYHFLKSFFSLAPSNKNIVCSSGSIVTVVWHMIHIKKNDTYIMSSQGDMGFELTAAIGSQIADKDKIVIPILGEGSFQLHIQELQTIVHYKLPIKILLFNNGGYGANIITQGLYFNNKYGCDAESNLSFPDNEKIAYCYGIKYISVKNNNEFEEKIEEFFNYNQAIILEVFCCVQGRYPKLSNIKNNDGTFTNKPYEDMEPFMDRKEFKDEMIVKSI
jgi:acetolactate synthase-1/2/3 large subunit